MRQLGSYELVHKLGQGGMGEVWAGRRRGLGGAVKPVAVKLIAPRHLDDHRLRDMFLAEARLSMLLTNSRIVQVFDVGEEDGTVYMVMEWIDGLNLAELTQELRRSGRRLSIEQVVFIVAELLRALAYAHELIHEGRRQVLVHRDVSPPNVMISVSGEVKLMDFGVARLSLDDSSSAVVKGKPRYMPPEQLSGRSRAPTIDLFAVGAIFHELLDNRKFRGDILDSGQLYGMILAGGHPPLSEPSRVPAALEAVRAGLLAAKVEARIQTARDALQQLYAWPGYRNAGLDLERIVSELLGRGARTNFDSGVQLAMTDTLRAEAGGTLVEADSTASFRSLSSASSPTPGRVSELGEVEQLETESRPRSQLETPIGDEDDDELVVAGRLGRRPLIIAALASTALLGIAVAALLASSAEHEGAQASDPAGLSVGEAPEGSATAWAPWYLAPSSIEPSAEGGERFADEEVAAEVLEPAPVGRRAPAPVPVEIFANSFYLELKLGRKSYVVQPRLELELAPGRYSLALRKRSSDPWTPAGFVKIEAGKAQTIEIIHDPPGAQVTSKQ